MNRAFSCRDCTGAGEFALLKKRTFRSAVATVLASTGGGLTSLVISMIRDKIIQIDMLIDGLLAALVASTACCPCLCPWEAVVVGTVAAALVFITYPILEKVEVL